ncbi:MAG: GNAT family N-acetyltransferase [Candidatus Thermoplasmatota archaeon]
MKKSSLWLPMDIVDYQEISDHELTELSLACFGHTHSKERLERMVKSDRRLPDRGGELYAVEGEKILGVVGLLYPKARTEEGIIDVGGIRNVCCRPSASREGVAKRLMKEAHEILAKKVRYSFLMTSASNVAYGLYKKLGYEHIYVPPKAFKKTDEVDSDVRFKQEEDPEYVRSVYLDTVENLRGLVIREKDFWNMAEARGWPRNENVRIAYKNGKRIGYAMFFPSRDRLSVKEIGAEKGFLPDILDGLESQTDKDHIVLSYVNANYEEKLKEKGYRWTQDLWSGVMAKDLRGENSDVAESLDTTERFHMGIYEAY